MVLGVSHKIIHSNNLLKKTLIHSITPDSNVCFSKMVDSVVALFETIFLGREKKTSNLQYDV